MNITKTLSLGFALAIFLGGCMATRETNESIDQTAAEVTVTITTTTSENTISNTSSQTELDRDYKYIYFNNSLYSSVSKVEIQDGKIASNDIIEWGTNNPEDSPEKFMRESGYEFVGRIDSVVQDVFPSEDLQAFGYEEGQEVYYSEETILLYLYTVNQNEDKEDKEMNYYLQVLRALSNEEIASRTK